MSRLDLPTFTVSFFSLALCVLLLLPVAFSFREEERAQRDVQFLLHNVDGAVIESIKVPHKRKVVITFKDGRSLDISSYKYPLDLKTNVKTD